MYVQFRVIKTQFAHFSFAENDIRITIDLDRDIIISPDNFFKKIAEENKKLQKCVTAVGRAVGRSISTASKYVQMKGVLQNVQLAVNNLRQTNL